jgi:hypothetical protein
MLQEQNVNDYYTETYTYGGLGHYGIYTFTLNTYTASGNEPTQTVVYFKNLWFLSRAL